MFGISNILPPVSSGRNSEVGADSFASNKSALSVQSANFLPPPKTQAYIAIFEDALDQLAVLGDIAPELGNIKTENKSLGEEITRILKDQRNLEAQHSDLLQKLEHLKAMPNKTQYKQSQLQILDINHQLQQSSQLLARSLKSHPSVAANLLKVQTERSALQTLISKTIRELRESKFDSLVSSVEEEYRKRNTLQNTINRESEASETLRKLNQELANERRLLEEETNDRNQVIQQLKDTIQEINALTASEQKYIKKETKAREASVKQQCLSKELNLQEEKAMFLKKMDQEKRAHVKTVDFLTRQREGLEKQIQEWMTKYEEDTEAKTLELESLKQRRTADLDKYEELVAAYEELETVVEEDKQTKIKEAEELRIQQMREKALIRLQRWWRRMLEIRREQEKAAKAAKKGKRGKGKKGSSKSAKSPKSPKSANGKKK